MQTDRKVAFAILLDHFHLTFEQIAGLTDTQIYNYYFHKRDDKGSIERNVKTIPLEPNSLMEELAQATAVASQFSLSHDELFAMHAAIRNKWSKDK